MTLQIEVGVDGRNYIRIDHKSLGWLIHAVTSASIGREDLPTVNSRVTRLNEELEVVSVGLRQPSEEQDIVQVARFTSFQQ